jgi:hypothetical protein
MAIALSQQLMVEIPIAKKMMVVAIVLSAILDTSSTIENASKYN